jgi:hypothetical protein
MVWPLVVGAAALGTVFYASRLVPRVMVRLRGVAGTKYVGRRPYTSFEYDFEAEMSRDEALMLLGFPRGVKPSNLEVKMRYKELMAAIHPDCGGGGTLMSAKVNEAKDVLIPPRNPIYD